MSKKLNLLIVDDDMELCSMLGEYLTPEGFDVDSVHDGKSGAQKVIEGSYDAMVLDVMLPELNGFEVLKAIRGHSDIPVLMLTARGDDVDRIVGLEIGADDYLPKPFNPRELVARLRAILRRAGETSAARKSSQTLEVGVIAINTGMMRAQVASQEANLTGAEFRVLVTLMRSAGQVVSRETLTQQALGRKLTLYDRSIDTHVSNLRKKLAAAGCDESPIRNVRGAGYILITPDDSE